MTYSTLLVHLDGGQTNEPVLAIAASLAAQYKARVIGIAACQPMQIGIADGDFTGGLAVLERDIVDGELKRAEAEFQTCAEIQPFVLEWRSSETLSASIRQKLRTGAPSPRTGWRCRPRW